MKTYPMRSDIVTAMANPKVSFKAQELMGGTIIRKGSRIIQYSGGYTMVFPFNSKNGKKIAVRCWIADIGDAHIRCQEISAYLQKLDDRYFTGFRMIENALLINGILNPVVVMDWREGLTLKEFINKNIGDSSKIRAVAEKFKEMVGYFHSQQIAHGDLQHGNILIDAQGDILVIDYDSMYVAPLNGMKDVIKGLGGYQHPARTANALLHSKLDYFSELVIYIGLHVFAEQPKLWPDFYQTEDLLFNKEDFADPYHSTLIGKLMATSGTSIKHLIQKMIEELGRADILHLRPLEELLVNELDDIAWVLDRMGNQPHPPVRPSFPLPPVDDTFDKFKMP